MRKIVPIISSFDAYGTLFNFTINRELKFKTFFGGIISLLTIFFIVYTTFLFGRDFFFRTNPKIVFMEEKHLSEPFHKKISNKNLTIAWRIEDTDRQQVDYPNGLFYPSINYLSYIYSNKKNETLKISKNIPIKKCNEIFASGHNLDLVLDYDLKPFNPAEWNCVDFDSFDDFYLGSFFYENYSFQRFEVSLNVCENESFKLDKTDIESRSDSDHFNQEQSRGVDYYINASFYINHTLSNYSNYVNESGIDGNFNYEIKGNYTPNRQSINDSNKNKNESFSKNLNNKQIKLNNTIQKMHTENLRFSTSNPKCSDISELKSFLSETKYISILYPKAHYSFTNFINPFKLIYKNYLTNLNLNLVKKDEFSLSMESLTDDDAWFFSTMNNYTGLSVSGIKSSVFFKENLEYVKNKVFYSFSFHLQTSHFQYFRSFMKFQDLAAIVGGFVKIVQIVLNAVYINYNIFSRDKFLINFLFENGKHFSDKSNDSNKNNYFRKSFLNLNNNNHYPNTSNIGDAINNSNKRQSNFNRNNKPDNKSNKNNNANGCINKDKSPQPRKSFNPNLSKIFDHFSNKALPSPINRLKANSIFCNANNSYNFNSNVNNNNSSNNHFLNFNNNNNNFFNENSNLKNNYNNCLVPPNQYLNSSNNYNNNNNNNNNNLTSLKNQDANSQLNISNNDSKLQIFSDDKGNVLENKLKYLNVLSEIEFRKSKSIKSKINNNENEGGNILTIEGNQDIHDVLQDDLNSNREDYLIQDNRTNNDELNYKGESIEDINQKSKNNSNVNNNQLENIEKSRDDNSGLNKKFRKFNSIDDKNKLTIGEEKVPRVNVLLHGRSLRNNFYKLNINSDNDLNNKENKHTCNQAITHPNDLNNKESNDPQIAHGITATKKYNNYFLNPKTENHLEDSTSQTTKKINNNKVNFRLSESISNYNNDLLIQNQNHIINASLNPFSSNQNNKELLGFTSNNHINAVNNTILNNIPKNFKLEFSSIRFKSRYSRNAKILNTYFFNYCCSKFCRRKLNREEERKIFIFEYAREYISKKLDLFKYLKNLTYLNIILDLIANQNQKTALKYLSQPCIGTEHFDIVKRRGTVKTPFDRHNGMIEYFKDSCETDNLTQFDAKILEMLNKKYSKM